MAKSEKQSAAAEAAQVDDNVIVDSQLDEVSAGDGAEPADENPAADGGSTTDKKSEQTPVKKSEAKPKPKAEAKPKAASTILEQVGKAAIKEHGLKEVFVTSDGTTFKLESDAKGHAANLKDKKVTKIV